MNKKSGRKLDREILTSLETLGEQALKSGHFSGVDYHGRTVEVSKVVNSLHGGRHQYKDIIKVVLSEAPARACVLDVGVGYGFYPIVLQEKYGFSVVATEVPRNIPVYTPFAQSKGINVVPCDLTVAPLPFKAGSFDVIIMAELIEHLRMTLLPVIQEASRVLKAGGLFVLTTPNLASIDNVLKLALGRNILDEFPKDSKGEDYRAHPREYTARELVAAARHGGLVDIKIQRKIRANSVFGKGSALTWRQKLLTASLALAQAVCYFQRPCLLLKARRPSNG